MINKEDKEKEEKRNNLSEAIGSIHRKTRKFTNNNAKICTKKPSMFSQRTEVQESIKQIKRIGCNHKISAYCCSTETQSISYSGEQQIIKLKQTAKLKGQKQIKRIGKQKITKAYIAYITSEGEEQRSLLEDTSSIKINKVEENLLTLNEENKSILHDICQDQNLIDLLEGCNEIQNILNSSTNIKDESNRFSINIKMIESDDDRSSKFEDTSAFQKSDQCIETSLRTDSENVVSKSDIIEGSINKITSDFGAKSENSSDSKISELIEEIQKNYQKNMENYPINRISESKDPQYLAIPENRSSFNRRQVKAQQHLPDKNKSEKTSIPTKEDTNVSQSQEMDNKLQKSQEEKILQELSHNGESKNKENRVSVRRSSNGKKKKSTINKEAQVKVKQKQPFKQIVNQNKPLSMYHSVQKYISTGQHLKNGDLTSTQKPKSINYDNKSYENLSSSGVNIVSPHINQLNFKNSQSKIDSPMKQRENLTISVHQKHEKQNLLKSQSIASRFTTKKNMEQEGISKMSGSIKNRNQNLEVNKCLMEARKIIKQIKQR